MIPKLIASNKKLGLQQANTQNSKHVISMNVRKWEGNNKNNFTQKQVFGFFINILFDLKFPKTHAKSVSCTDDG